MDFQLHTCHHIYKGRIPSSLKDILKPQQSSHWVFFQLFYKAH
uniref:Uncharacterized protein n=1 Tax=Cucumis melo TaxID=3656 RepID=A0A9I9EEH6_CUCME